MLVRIVDGVLKKGQRIRMIGIDAGYEVDRVGVFTPKLSLVDELGPGEIGMLTASIKEVADTRVGDTITDERNPVDEPLPGFRPAVPVVFCGLFPVDAAQFEDLRAAMGKLRLNDASFSFEMETSAALGFGFRCGFLGLLHLEIIQERLEREFNLELIATAPSVIYKIKTTDGRNLEIHNPVDMPEPNAHRGNAGAVDRGDHPDARRIPRRRAQALSGPTRLTEGADLRRRSRDGEVRPAAQRGGVRLLRPAEVGVAAATRRSTIT